MKIFIRLLFEVMCKVVGLNVIELMFFIVVFNVYIVRNGLVSSKVSVSVLIVINSTLTSAKCNNLKFMKYVVNVCIY